MSKSRLWSRAERLIAFRVYCSQPFGRLHTGNPAVQQVAELIGRSPSAVVFKACNFASLDPYHQARGVRGFRNAGRDDRALWEEFEQDSAAIAAEAEAAYQRFGGREVEDLASSSPAAAATRDSPSLTVDSPEGPTETEQVVRARRVQRFFRTAVLAGYSNACAISGVPIPALLNASHIIPWTASVERRADPRNGIALHALYDRAFDRGLLTFDEERRVVVSPRLRVDDPTPLHRRTLLDIEGEPLRVPERFLPDEAALAWHREHVFDG